FDCARLGGGLRQEDRILGISGSVAARIWILRQCSPNQPPVMLSGAGRFPERLHLAISAQRLLSRLHVNYHALHAACPRWCMDFLTVEPLLRWNENQQQYLDIRVFGGNRPVSCRFILAGAFLMLAWLAPASARDIALISNKANTPTNLNLVDLVKICKGQTNH